ncbi:MAG: hypothetical protein ACP5NF_03135 [Thermoanaerobaculum sp.]
MTRGVFAGWVLAGALTGAPAFAGWAVRWHVQIPQDLSASDLRWGTKGFFVLSAKKQAIFGPLPVGVAQLPAGNMVLVRGQPGMPWLPANFASDGRFWVVSAPSQELSWTDGQGHFGRKYVGVVNDVDAASGLVAMIGCTANEANRWALDGGLVFLGSLGRDLEDLRPIYHTEQVGEASPMVRCGMLRLGRLRFLSDGTLVAFPGVVPGLLFFDRDGNLVRMLGTEALGLDTGCEVTYDSALFNDLLTDDKTPFAFLNQRRTVDEILPLGQGPGLVVRVFADGTTRWELVVVGKGGTATREPLPLPPGGPFSRIAGGDVSGGNVLLLRRETFLKTGTATGPWEVFLLEKMP